MTQLDATEQLIESIRVAAETAGFAVQSYSQFKRWPLLALTRAAQETDDTQHIYLSTGIHGDEPAGPQALLELLATDALPRHHHYAVFPVLNPEGLHRGTRENADGIDLNRDYERPRSKEIQAHLGWITQRLRRVDLSIHLHEDWESRGFYLYELNLDGHASRANAILEAVAPRLPIETATLIDGREACGGIIRPREIPNDLEGLPEAIFLRETYQGIHYTLETPSALPREQRVLAMKAAVLALL